MSEIRSGLLDMESRPRRVQPPRHPKREVAPPPAPEPVAPPAAQASSVAGPRVEKRKRPALRGVQVYLDEAALQILQDCRNVGDVSASAVMRLALAELRSRTTPHEIARMLLIDENPAYLTPGRKVGS